jgi:serine/threonine protein kinase
MSNSTASPSRTSFGPFQLQEKIGRGQLGTVYKAHQAGAATPVALKIAHADVAEDHGRARRFHHEFVAARALRHPHIVEALGHGVEHGLPYLVLEYVPGRSLAAEVRETGPLPVRRAKAVFRQIAEAVAFVHQRDQVLRVIKPCTILLDGKNGAKLADLGLIMEPEVATQLTRLHAAHGTIEFAAPEQFDDARRADARCDIYSLAATLYFALTGRTAFGPGSLAAVLTRKLAHRFTPLLDLVPEAGATLSQFIARALHPDPEMRPISADEFVQHLAREKEPEAIAWAGPAPGQGEQDKRRTAARYQVNLPTSCEAMNPASEKDWPARILDISTGGLCVEVPEHLTPGTALRVAIPEPNTDSDQLRCVTVRWSKALANDQWMLGCAFAEPLDDDELDALLASDHFRATVFGA